jgi:hypothetical protein
MNEGFMQLSANLFGKFRAAQDARAQLCDIHRSVTVIQNTIDGCFDPLRLYIEAKRFSQK